MKHMNKIPDFDQQMPDTEEIGPHCNSRECQKHRDMTGIHSCKFRYVTRKIGIHQQDFHSFETYHDSYESPSQLSVSFEAIFSLCEIISEKIHKNEYKNS